ncbi:group III truncated hemoglobin [Prosthecobacter dejongeii]|uniref:Hemoglobin n=1 Tax=Prosthecobacter dejongeii TaxID=48465 RepID=A0A7W7YGV0_9BACT|nr:group III truncated hemoglobin [Prosthecobacter dejongeii]MBB5035963.1 hemoglobin [Prosthecobacter dejongeii]
MTLSNSSLTDLHGRAEIEQLVNAFYEHVREDDVLGFIFTDIARTDWTAHLPRMYAFWETVLFRTGGYTGNPLAVHARLLPLTAMGRPQFDRWLLLFHRTVDAHFAGPNAEHIKNCASDMANVIHRRLSEAPVGATLTVQLTPEQQVRDAPLKADAV